MAYRWKNWEEIKYGVKYPEGAIIYREKWYMTLFYVMVGISMSWAYIYAFEHGYVLFESNEHTVLKYLAEVGVIVFFMWLLMNVLHYRLRAQTIITRDSMIRSHLFREEENYFKDVVAIDSGDDAYFLVFPHKTVSFGWDPFKLDREIREVVEQRISEAGIDVESIKRS